MVSSSPNHRSPPGHSRRSAPVESHEQWHALSTYLQFVREEERTRIAREVHDELGQALTALKLQLVWMTSRLPKELGLLHEQARLMARHIDQTIQTVRRIATELRPGVLDTAGLPAAIEWQARQFEMRTGIRCRVKSTLRDTLWDQDLNTALFRIFQEALTNIVRHAGATKVQVHLSETGRDVVLEIRDNGRGIADAEIHSTTSIGLLGIRERASLLGGRAAWRGSPGRGTAVRVSIPLRRPAPASTTIEAHENTPHRRPRRRAAGSEINSR